MHRATWIVVLLSVTMLQFGSLASDSSNSDCVEQVLGVKTIAQNLQKKLDTLNADVNMYDTIVNNFLQPTYETIQLQNQISSFTTSVNDQLNAISGLKERLTRDETFMNTSLSRQEEQMSILEPQLSQIENKWRNQSTELDQLKQLWDDVSQKAVTRGGEVQSLAQSIAGLEERLTEQTARVDQQESDAKDLDRKLDSAEESLRNLQDVVQESLNKQGQLEGLLKALQAEIAEVRAGGGGGGGGGGNDGVPTVPDSRADSLCRRLTGN